MKKLYSLLLFATFATHSQTFQWLQTPEVNTNLNPGLNGYCNSTDNSGNSFVAGFKDNAFAYGEIFGDVFLNKYDGSGEIQFSKTFTGRILVVDIANDILGNVYMAIGYVNFATIGSLQFSTINQGIQPLLVKLDSDGNVLWHYIPTIPDTFEANFRALTTDDSGNVYIGYDSFWDSFIQKLSPDGVPQLLISQENANLISSIDIDTEGNIYAAGSCADINATYSGVAVQTNFLYNTYVVKYSDTGVFQWMHYVDDITCPTPEVKANSPDEVYFSSALFGAFAFGDIATDGPNGGFGSDFFVAKLNASGSFQWVREVPNPANGSIDVPARNFLETDNQGNVYFTAQLRDSIDWNGFVTSAGNFSSDALILKYDSSGNMLMAKNYGGASEDRIDAISLNAQGDMIVSGMLRGNVNLDGIIHESAGNSPYPYLAKISASSLGNQNDRLPFVGLWPNPVTNELHLMINDSLDGTIFNTLGQKIQTFKSDGNSPIDVRSLQSGIYFLKIDGFQTVKFVKR